MGLITIFFDIVIAAGHHADVLVIPGLFLMKSLLDNVLHGTMKVLCEQAILLIGYDCQIIQIWEVLKQELLPGSLVLSLEYVLKLHIGVSPVEFIFSASILNSGMVLLIVNWIPSFSLSLLTLAITLL
jgi:hypothetical protein